MDSKVPTLLDGTYFLFISVPHKMDEQSFEKL